MTKLQELMEKNGINVVRIASETGITKGTITRFLNGNGRLKASGMRKIARVFGMDKDIVFPDTPTVTTPDPEEVVEDDPIEEIEPETIFKMRSGVETPKFDASINEWAIKAVSFVDSAGNKTTAGANLFDYEQLQIDTGIEDFEGDLLVFPPVHFVVDYWVRMHPRLVKLGNTYKVIASCYGGDILRIYKGDVVCYAHAF